MSQKQIKIPMKTPYGFLHFTHVQNQAGVLLWEEMQYVTYSTSVRAGLNMGMLFWHRHHIHTQYSHLMVYSQKKKNTLTERRVKYREITIYILKWSLHLFHSSTGDHSTTSSQYVYLSQVTRLMCTRTHLVGPVAKRFRVVDLLA